jgi:hypothetical protein
MSEKGPLGRRPDRRGDHDIAPILRGWDYEPGVINVRKVLGLDGQPKLQMRLDLGLLQMEMTGRPDGSRPHGCESLLDYYEEELREHRHRNGTDLGFHLTAEQCQALREEAVMYYHRYLSLFFLEEFSGVVRDTERNIRVLDLCAKFAVDDHDRLILEQYRPYLIMLNSRAQAGILERDNRLAEALHIVKMGLEKIHDFFAQFNSLPAYARSNEVRVLRKFARQLRGKIPVDEVTRLRGKLERAIKHEKYEEAARLRDEINRRAALESGSGDF